MKFTRNILILCSLIFLLSAAIVCVSILRPATTRLLNSPLFDLSASAVQSIDITLNNAHLQCKRQGYFWELTSATGRAWMDPAAVSHLFDFCESLTIEGLADPTLTLEAPNALTLRTVDESKSYLFGQPFPLRPTEIPVIDEQLNQRYHVRCESYESFTQTLQALRAKVLIPAPQESITAIEWRAPNLPFTRVIRASNNDWNVTQPETFTVKAADVAPLLNLLTQIPLEAYLSPKEVMPTASLAEPSLNLSSTRLQADGLDDENCLRLMVYLSGYEVPFVFRFGNTDSEHTNAVKCFNEQTHCILSISDKLPALLSTKGPFAIDEKRFNRTVLAFDLNMAPTSLTIQASELHQTLQLSLRDGTWSIFLPAQLPANDASIATLLRSLRTISGTPVKTPTPFTPPLPLRTEISMTTPITTVTYKLYAEPNKPMGFLVKDNGTCLQVALKDLPEVFVSPTIDKQFIDKTVLKIDVRTITRLQHDTLSDGHMEAIRYQPTLQDWSLEAPRGVYLAHATIQPLLQQFELLTSLRVICYAPDIEETLTSATPSINDTLVTDKWTIDLSEQGSPRQILYLGQPNPVTGNAPLVLKGRPVIYEMDAQTLSRLKQSLLEEPTP